MIYLSERKISPKKLWLMWFWRAMFLYVLFSFSLGIIVALTSNATNTIMVVNPSIIITLGFISLILSTYLAFQWVLRANYIVVKTLKI